jgi:hypothetical protein
MIKTEEIMYFEDKTNYHAPYITNPEFKKEIQWYAMEIRNTAKNVIDRSKSRKEGKEDIKLYLDKISKLENGIREDEDIPDL